MRQDAALLRSVSALMLMALIHDGVGCQEPFDLETPSAEDAQGLLHLLRGTHQAVSILAAHRDDLEALGDQPLDREARELLMPL